jgi:hypothetical protein
LSNYQFLKEDLFCEVTYCIWTYMCVWNLAFYPKRT